MGLTQTSLAKLSGLSRATVNQVENGTINDLSLTRASKLLGVLGLSVSVAAPRAMPQRGKVAKSSALDLAARTASVSFRVPMRAEQLRDALTSEAVPKGFAPHIHTLLEEASVSLLASVAEELHNDTHRDRTLVWKRMKDLARQFKSSRELWQ
jgi:transcriptional regulator with XRE-family HTH domain